LTALRRQQAVLWIALLEDEAWCQEHQ
jgi:hypothetical protein